ncbi:helix-turn-helix domain-containing protein [Pseudoxanthomonas winnipegensis]|uniref:Helix-turn-helix domain-containing protein n=1 Tax=Pseudoxanthomonas winnipegensis TaxID=2480810 RepID=A0A4Q8M9U9_9GAMM|nr:helix-turn-helix domain-containing protein [Pseudoxanthomonas winnipegensis]
MDEARSKRHSKPYEAGGPPLDLAALAGLLKVCDLDVVLLDRQGACPGVATSVDEDALIYAITNAFTFRGRFTLPPDWCLFGYVHHTDPSASWCHGVSMDTGMVVTVLPGASSEFVLSADSRLTLVLIPLSALKQRLSELGLGASLPTIGQYVRLFRPSGDATARRLEQLATRLAQWSRESGPQETSDRLEGASAYVRAHLMAKFSATPDDRPRCSRGRLMHYRILRRAEDFMRLHMHRNVYMQEICNNVGVSERTLRYAFDELLGISPNRYLSMLRLCTANRSLSASDASRHSVKSIALNCGLWDLSKFAGKYRRIFGELPSDTLLRSPPVGIWRM